MPIIVKEGKTYTPAPAGAHQAVCCDVVDLGEVEVTYQQKTRRQHKIRVVWEIDEAREDGRPFQVNRRYTASLDPKSSLRKDLASWRGRDFTPEELSGFDLEKLIGANCMLNIVHTEREGSKYANVSAVMPLARGMQKFAVTEAYVRVKDRPADGEHAVDEENPHGISDDDVPF